MRFKEAILEFGFDCRARKLSDKTISNYQKQLHYLERYLGAEYGITEVEDVRSLHLKEFLVSMDEKGRKPRYINDLLKVFKTFFNYLKREAYIRESPAAKVHNMKQPKVKIITFSEEEIRKLLNYYQGRSFLNIRNRTMLALFFDTGMRLTEVITLQAEQIREDSIIVHGKGNKERLVPVSPYLAKALMQYQMVREAYFDGKLPERYGKAIVEVIEILAKMLPEISIRYYMARTLSMEGEDRCCFSYRLAFNAKIQYNRYVYLLMKRMCLFATYRPICMIWEDKRIVMNELFQRFVLNTKEVLHLIRIAIVEDDEAERIRIKEYLTYLEETDHLQFEIDSFPSGLAFIAQYTGQFDIVLMDIDMPGMDGVETARALREVDQSAILVFVTNMAQYAISGYEVEALDFILKPIKKFSFAIKMRRAVARTEKKNDDTICVKQDGVTHLLLISQIKYLEVEGHYVAYHTSNGIYSEYTTLKKAEKRINRTWFAQCNQSYLLNMKYINSLSRDSVVVDGKEIFISRKMRHSFLAAVAEFLGGKNQ